MNGPHAMVSMNDGFGGADDVAGNLMMNSNRQTFAHGVINLWVSQLCWFAARAALLQVLLL